MATGDRKRNVFVLGMNEMQAEQLETIADADRFEFHPLLHKDEIVDLADYDMEAKLDETRAILDAFDGPVDAIIGQWDFPVMSMVAILCAEYGLVGPSLESVLKCTHKYWSRLEQRAAAPDCTPAFCAVDPFDENALDNLEIDFPFWLKAVNSWGSMLGFRVDDADDFREALAVARRDIRRVGEPLDALLARAELPEEIRRVGGSQMIAEALIGGWELAPEGYIQHGEFHAHGMIDMVRGPNGKSFQRYQYPSRAPDSVRDRAINASRKILEAIGYDDGCFNVEFFWDEESDDLYIIEINPRASQSHSDLFSKIDGMSNHEVAVRVALGDPPHLTVESGPYQHSAKFLYRRYDTTDAVAVRVPEAEDLARLEREQADTVVNIDLEKGMRLSELKNQDPYSYILADLSIGADNVEELEAKYERAIELLPFEFEPVDETNAEHSTRDTA